MEIINVNIKNINISEYNPRKLSPVDKKQLKLSIEKFGIVDPLILNNNISRKNILIGGHQRLKIWKSLKHRFYTDGGNNFPEHSLNHRTERKLFYSIISLSFSLQLMVNAKQFSFYSRLLF